MIKDRRLVATTLILAAASLVAPASAKDCQDYAGGIRWLETLDFTYSNRSDLVLAGDLGYTAMDQVAILDLSDPGSPRQVGEIASDYIPTRLDLVGDLLVVAIDGHDLELYSLADPLAPALIQRLPIGDYPLDIRIVDDWCYVASLASGLIPIDINDPAAPVVHASVDDGARYESVDAQDGVLYCATDGELLVYDLVDPQKPAESFRWGTDAVEPVALGDRLFLSRGASGFTLFDLADPLQPLELGQMTDVSASRAAARSGDALFVLGGGPDAPTLRCYDIGGAAPWPLQGSIVCANNAWAVGLHGDQAYVAATSKFETFDVSDPADVVSPLGVEETSSEFAFRYHVVAGGGYAYVTNSGTDNESSFLEVIDIRDPAHPELVQELMGHRRHLWLAGDLLYAVNFGIEVYDVSDPPNTWRVGEMDWDYNTNRIVGDAGYLYALQGYKGLLVASILDDPTAPVLVGELDLWGYSHEIAIADDLAFILVNQDRLYVVDISVPENPLLVGELLGLGGESNQIVVKGETAYISDWDQVLIVNISEPSAPALVDSVPTHHINKGLAIRGEVLYVAGRALQVLDIAEPWSPEWVGELPVGFGGSRVTVSEELVCVTSHNRLFLAPLDCLSLSAVPQETAPDVGMLSIAGHPNPFNPTTRIRFTMPAAGEAQLAVHDATGRRLRMLLLGHREAGSHELDWDGRDAAGRELPSGVYLVEFRAGERRAATKLTLLR